MDEYTSFGEITYMGEECNVIMVSGNAEPKDQWGFNLFMEDILIFDVSQDGTAITPRTGFGAVVVSKASDQVCGYLDFNSAAEIIKRQDAPAILAWPSELVFEGSQVAVGVPMKENIYLCNPSYDDGDFYLTSSSKEIDMGGNRIKIFGGTSGAVKVTFTPANEGEFTGTLTFSADSGKPAVINIKANVAPAPDYSKVIKSGDVLIYNSGTTPFELTEDITGFPVLKSTNKEGSTSILNALVDVPKGKIGMFSWKGKNYAHQPNGVTISVDDNTLICDNIYSYPNTYVWDDISNTIALPAGKHLITYENVVMMDWYEMGMSEEPCVSYFYDFDFAVKDEVANFAVLKNESVDFGQFYFDKLPATGIVTVQLLNAGTAPLQVNSISSDGIFSGVVPDEQAPFAETLPVILTFSGNGVDSYEGDVVITTNAGDFTVHCKAQTLKVPVDYSPIVSEGTFSFDTSNPYPFTLNGTKTYSGNSNSFKGGNNYNSWLTASFEVPENMDAELSWEARNSSQPYYEFMGEKIFTSGTRIYIDNEMVLEVVGEDTSCGSDKLDAKLLTFGAGIHSLKFEYVTETTTAGRDRVDVWNLGLKLKTSGITDVSDDTCVVKREYYSPSGIKLSEPTGLTIVVETLSDGTRRTLKTVG